jgi:hypothetical protein
MPINETQRREVLKEAYSNPLYLLPQDHSKWVTDSTWDYLDHLNLKGKIALTFQDRIHVRKLCVSYLKSLPEYEDHRQKIGFIPVWLIGILINIIVKIILDHWLKNNERIG